MPTWVTDAARDIVSQVRAILERTMAPGSTKPPPGTITAGVADIILKYIPKDAAPVAVKKEEPNRALTIDEIYAKPPVTVNYALPVGKPALEKIIDVITSRKSCRVSDVVKATGLTKEEVTGILETPGSGYEIVKPGWIKAA